MPFIGEFKPLLFRVIIKEWLLISVILLFGDLFLDTLQFVLELFITCDPVTSKVFFFLLFRLKYPPSILYSVIFRVIHSVEGSLHTWTHTAVTTCTRTIPDQTSKNPSISDEGIIKSHFLVEELLACGGLWG